MVNIDIDKFYSFNSYVIRCNKAYILKSYGKTIIVKVRDKIYIDKKHAFTPLGMRATLKFLGLDTPFDLEKIEYIEKNLNKEV